MPHPYAFGSWDETEYLGWPHIAFTPRGPTYVKNVEGVINSDPNNLFSITSIEMKFLSGETEDGLREVACLNLKRD